MVGVAIDLQKTRRIRTQRGEKHEARKGDDPVIHGINDVTTVELEEEVRVRALE